MKKYLTLAAILGAIAFLSVSYLAQADEKTEMAPAAAEKPADAPAAPADAMAAPAAPVAPAAEPTAYEKDADMCDILASSPTTEGTPPTAEAKDTAFKTCITGKGHTDDEMKMAADKKKAAATPAAPTAPAADAPAMAPATDAPKAEEAPAAK